jgi:acyl dehydratase
VRFFSSQFFSPQRRKVPVLLTTITAVNDPGSSTNPIHSDEDAQRLGLRGGWVGGPTLLGYLADAAVRRWGTAWLASGGMDARFRAPVHDGDELAVEVDDAHGDPAGAATVQLRLVNAEGVACTVAEVRPPGSSLPVPPEPEVGPEPEEEDKPVVSADVLGRLPALTTIDHEAGRGGPAAPVPLQDLVGASIDIMYATFRPDGPRIITRLVTTQLAAADPGSVLVARGHVAASWERRGRTYATNSVLLSTRSGAPVLHVANTTIWRMPS